MYGVGCVRCGSFHDRLATGRLPRQQSSHGTKRRNAEGKIVPHPGDELGPAETRHVVIGDDKIEFRFRGARCVQCREAVGYCNDLKAIVGENPGDYGLGLPLCAA